jgi:hypothetical protein
MNERQPTRPPIPEPQQTPHKGGNGALGTPPILNERAKPPPEDAQGNPPGENPSSTQSRGAVFECVTRLGKLLPW